MNAKQTERLNDRVERTTDELRETLEQMLRNTQRALEDLAEGRLSPDHVRNTVTRGSEALLSVARLQALLEMQAVMA